MMMTYDKLRQAKDLRREIEVLERLIKEASDTGTVTMCTDGIFAARPRSDKVMNLVLRRGELKAELEAAKQRLDDMLISISRWIDTLPSSSMRTISRLRFLAGREWEQVAEEAGYGSGVSARKAWERYMRTNGLLGYSRQGAHSPGNSAAG